MFKILKPMMIALDKHRPDYPDEYCATFFGTVVDASCAQDSDEWALPLDQVAAADEWRQQGMATRLNKINVVRCLPQEPGTVKTLGKEDLLLS